MRATRTEPRIPAMYRPAMASWFQSLAQRLPLKAVPTAKQVEIAKQFTGQPDLPWCRLSYATVHALVWAQAAQAEAAMDGRLVHELMAAMTWNREIIVPDPARLLRVTQEPVLPNDALAALAEIPQQTVYLLLEQPAVEDPSVFVNGAWLMRDYDSDTEGKLLLVLLDLLVNGQPVRDVLLEFSVEASFEESIERQIEKTAQAQGWDLASGAIARRANLRAYLRAARPVIAAFYDTLVANRVALQRARAHLTPDELGFTLVDVAHSESAPRQLASGRYH